MVLGCTNLGIINRPLHMKESKLRGIIVAGRRTPLLRSALSRRRLCTVQHSVRGERFRCIIKQASRTDERGLCVGVYAGKVAVQG